LRISDVYSSLIATFDDWKHILVNRSFVRRHHTISWENYLFQRLPDIVHRSNINNLEDMGQYSFQVIDDGSIFQLYYEYRDDDKTLASANLAFFGSGLSDEIFKDEINSSLRANVIDGEITEWDDDNLINSYALEENDPLVPWLRVDYKPEEEQGPLHHGCHMHIGLFQHARIPITRVPTPRQFVEFIFAICYPHHYRERRLDVKENFEPFDLAQLRGFNSSCFPQTNGNVFDILPYIGIPSR